MRDRQKSNTAMDFPMRSFLNQLERSVERGFRLTEVHDSVQRDILALLSHNSLPFSTRVSGCPSATRGLQLFGGYCGKTMV